MGYFSLKADCAICGENVGLASGKSRLELKDGWICGTCMKKMGKEYPVLKVKKMTTEEVKKIISEKEFHSESNAPIKEYKVIYLGGYPDHLKKKTNLKLSFYDSRFIIETTINQDFKPIYIDYSNIYDVKVVERTLSSFEGLAGGLDSRQLNQANNIHIRFNQNENELILRLEMLEGITVMKQAQKCLELMDFIRTSGIDTKFLKKKDSSPNENTSAHFDEIIQFKKLLDLGIISEEEFEKKKKELLNL